MRIGQRTIGHDQPPYVIAELGVNHDGDVSKALRLVDAAVEAGADAVKLQLFDARRLLSRAADLAAYQRGPTVDSPDELLAGLELDARDMTAVLERARARGLHGLVTVFCIDLVEPAETLRCEAYKVASPDLVNRPLVEALMATGRPLVLSTGAATLDEVRQTVQWLGEHPCALMQCVSAYPTPDECASIAGLSALRDLTPAPLGYSDHTTSTLTGAVAVAHGARILEKHLTYDRAAAGPDHATSLDAGGFKEYVEQSRLAFSMLGRPEKQVLDIEQDVRRVSRQSLVSVRDLCAGHRLERTDVTVKRPGDGIAPARLEEIIGRTLTAAVAADTPIRETDLA